MNKKTDLDIRQKEKHFRRMEIMAKYQMRKNIRGYMILTLVLSLIALIVSLWGFGVLSDSLMVEVSVKTKAIIAWVTAIFAGVALVVGIFLFYILGNAKKHILMLIENYNKRYPSSKYDGETFSKNKK